MAATLLVPLTWPHANASPPRICDDHSPAAVAETLDIDLGQSAPRRSGKPNVIIINVDDLGYADVGAYGGKIPTPNIDRIAAEGARFNSGYAASSICSPSRAGLMSGKQPNTLGYANNLYEHWHPHQGLPLSEKTLADYFKEAGYVTGIVGKWHLGFGEKHQPLHRGFDEAIGPIAHDSYNYYLEGPPPTPAGADPGRDVWSRMGPCKDNDKYLTDVQGMEATAFILRHRDEPFLMYFSPIAVHSPYHPRQENLLTRLAYYRLPGYARHVLDRPRRYYLRMLMQLDEAIGHILDTLDLLGLSENTLVWFFSDNGGAERVTDNRPLRSIKGDIYEGGIRVPFMVRWPGVISPAVYDGVISALDVLPTSIAAAGSRSILSSSLDGMNVLPYLKQGKNIPPRTLYWRNHWIRVPFTDIDLNHSHSAIRKGEWKLISWSVRPAPYNDVQPEPYKYELYNLQRDVSESENLVAKHPEIFISLRKDLGEWIKSLPNLQW